MPNSDSSFFKTIPKLSRDPLGIIALFIALTYAIASLVLAFGSNLTESQKWPLIIFLVGFPLIVLFSFLWLVIKYNQKLYAPSDFRSDESFLKTLKPGEAVQHQHEDSMPTISAKNLSVKDSAKAAESPGSGVFQVKVAEDLVLRDLEIEWGLPFRRQMGVKPAADLQTLAFTGVAQKKDELIVVDVRFPGLQNKGRTFSFEDITQKLQLLSESNFTIPMQYIVALVTEHNSDQGKKTITQKAKVLNGKYEYAIKVKWYDFDDLLIKYDIH